MEALEAHLRNHITKYEEPKNVDTESKMQLSQDEDASGLRLAQRLILSQSMRQPLKMGASQIVAAVLDAVTSLVEADLHFEAASQYSTASKIRKS